MCRLASRPISIPDSCLNHSRPVFLITSTKLVWHQLMSSAVADQLRTRAIDEIRRRWITPAGWDKNYRAPTSGIASLAKSALDSMLVRDFRVTPYPPAEEYEQLLARVQHWVARSEPIQIRIGYSPMKNP